MYALVDCNSFYASCEQIFRPDLRGKPVIVLSNNDGCIIARNKEAKTLQIPDLVPFFQVREQVTRLGCHVFSSNYELYGDISRRVMHLLEEYAEALEVYSIDEAFLQLSGKDLHKRGKQIKADLWQQVGMPVCVGIAPTKTLAKLANRAAKKIPKLQGVCVLDEAHKWQWLLARFTPQDIWGVGSRLAARLQVLGIDTALSLAQSDPKWLRKHFSVVLERTVRELNGEPCMNLEPVPEPRQEILCSRSFSYKITELTELQQATSRYAERACEKLRQQDSLCQLLWVYLESTDDQSAPHRRQLLRQLPYATNDTRLIVHQATEVLVYMYRKGLRYKKCGVGLLELRPRHFEQQDLFGAAQKTQSFSVMQVIDKINSRYGKHSIQLASSGIDTHWQMRRDLLSPRYTTRWQDLPQIKC
jgi:DNA polymerase V